MIYFDTAYILKCYVKEHGWEKVRGLASAHERIVCSVYGRLELHAALHRKLREGELTERQRDIVLRQLSVDETVRLWEWIPMSAPVMSAVAETFARLCDGVYLRTGDAVHLVSAREIGCNAVYSNDRHLLAAAAHLGIEGRDVIEPCGVAEHP